METELIDTLLNATPEVLMGLVVVGLCYALKFSRFPNRFIPLVCVLLPSVVYPFLADAGTPLLRRVCVGFLLGLLAWVLHNRLLKRFLDPHWFGDDDQIPPAPPPK